MAEGMLKDKSSLLSSAAKRLLPQPVNQEEENRKILESLQMKRTLLQQSVASPVRPTISASRVMPQVNQASLNQQQQLLSEVFANSLGYYVFQDSKFGNTIMPAIPRLPPNAPSSNEPSLDAEVPESASPGNPEPKPADSSKPNVANAPLAAAKAQDMPTTNAAGSTSLSGNKNSALSVVSPTTGNVPKEVPDNQPAGATSVNKPPTAASSSIITQSKSSAVPVAPPPMDNVPKEVPTGQPVGPTSTNKPPTEPKPASAPSVASHGVTTQTTSQPNRKRPYMTNLDEVRVCLNESVQFSIDVRDAVQNQRSDDFRTIYRRMLVSLPRWKKCSDAFYQGNFTSDASLHDQFLNELVRGVNEASHPHLKRLKIYAQQRAGLKVAPYNNVDIRKIN